MINSTSDNRIQFPNNQKLITSPTMLCMYNPSLTIICWLHIPKEKANKLDTFLQYLIYQITFLEGISVDLHGHKLAQMISFVSYACM